MPKICYLPDRKFTRQNLVVVDQANEILMEYQAQGFTLTLRQLYYQFVARDLMANTSQNYKRLGDIINDARLAGLVDWNHLVDRTRNLRFLEQFEDASDALDKVASWYHIDMWERQAVRPEVWVEKDALVGIVQKVCDELDVPYFSCRGYTSQSEMWRAGQRLQHWNDAGYHTHIIHLGDHDPSGMDMSRDITDRLALFMGGTGFDRIALNMDQVKQYNPPPNPAKITDSRCKNYITKFGRESWELDALEPNVLINLIRAAINPLRDMDIWYQDQAREQEVTMKLESLSERWGDVSVWLDGDDPDKAALLDALRSIRGLAIPARVTAKQMEKMSVNDRNKNTLKEVREIASRAIDSVDG